MSAIEHSRGNITLKRFVFTWEFTVEGKTTQRLTLTDPKDVEDLKAVIGQVEHAYRVLSGERER